MFVETPSHNETLHPLNRTPEGVFLQKREPSKELVRVPRGRKEIVHVPSDEQLPPIGALGRIAAARCGSCLLQNIKSVTDEAGTYDGKDAKRDICPGILHLTDSSVPVANLYAKQAADCAARSSKSRETASYRPDIPTARKIGTCAKDRLETIGIMLPS